MSLPTSAVAIVNMGLSYIGAGGIESFEEGSAQSEQAKLWYDPSRKQALAAFNWNFARKRLQLAVHGDAAPQEWQNRYQYPSDCLSARYIVNPAITTGPGAPSVLFSTAMDPMQIQQYTDNIPFEVERSDDGTLSIVTNECCPTLVYTFDQDDPVMFTPGFIDTLSLLFAYRAAFAITGKRSIAGDALKAYNMTLRAAAAADAGERGESPPRDAEWIRARA